DVCRDPPSLPTRRSSDLGRTPGAEDEPAASAARDRFGPARTGTAEVRHPRRAARGAAPAIARSRPSQATVGIRGGREGLDGLASDRKSTRLYSSHVKISY